jgi:hypothetical protein
MVAPREGIISNFHEAFAELHLGQPLALAKCPSGDRRDDGINPNTDHIARDSLSARPCVDEDGIARHY